MNRKKSADNGPAESFEDRLEDLQESLRLLEQGDLSLEESLAEYERGLALLKACYKTLEEAERKIEILSQREDGRVSPQPFQHEAWRPRDGG